MGASSPLSRLHDRIDAVLSRVEDGAAIVAGLVLLAMMALVSADAVLRHLFAAPLTFQFHLTEKYLLVASVMLALPWGYRRGGAIQVRMLLDSLPSPVAAWIGRLGLIASAIYLLAIARWSWRVFYKAHVDNQVVMGVIDWPVDWSLVWVPLGCFLLALRLLLDAAAPRLRPIGASSHD